MSTSDANASHMTCNTLNLPVALISGATGPTGSVGPAGPPGKHNANYSYTQ
jgi:hypothetical protein